jgi:AcrR family transcriptional regulator
MPARTLTSTWTGPDQAERRIVDAALVCIARFGIAKMTVDDVAAQAGCSRATLYRHVRGKREVIAAVLRHEADRVLAALDDTLAAAATLEDALVDGIVLIATEFEGHEALQFVLAHEPELLLPHLSFGSGDRFLMETAAVLGPRLERFLPPTTARRIGEWAVRIVLSYACNPSTGLRITDPDDVRHLVRDFVLPGTRTESAGSNH